MMLQQHMALQLLIMSPLVKSAVGKNSLKIDRIDPNALVTVYNVAGILICKNVLAGEAIIGLNQGVYLVGGKKVLVTR